MTEIWVTLMDKKHAYSEIVELHPYERMPVDGTLLGDEPDEVDNSLLCEMRERWSRSDELHGLMLRFLKGVARWKINVIKG